MDGSWTDSSVNYTQTQNTNPADAARLTNKPGDGKFDQSIIPTAVEPGDGGVYVGQSTELLHFKDTDGNGVADKRRVVLSGFGTEDTHYILHTFRWGNDGRLWFNQSIYIHSHV